jgi:hypothetical protein
MAKGHPGTGPTAGRTRQAWEPPRRRGTLSIAERALIHRLAADQPGSVSEAALERRIDKLALTLRRSAAAVRKAFHSERIALDDKRAVTVRSGELLTNMRRLTPHLKFLGEFLNQVNSMPARIEQQPR